MVDKVNSLGNLIFDPTNTTLVRWDATGRQVIPTRTKLTSFDEQMFVLDVVPGVSSGNDGIKMIPGLIQRGELIYATKTATTPNPYTSAFDLVTNLSYITNPGTFHIYVFAVLVSVDNPETTPWTKDWTQGGAAWSSANGAVKILFKTTLIAASNEYTDPFDQFILIGEFDMVNGRISNLRQHHSGPKIQDGCEWNSGDTGGQNHPYIMRLAYNWTSFGTDPFVTSESAGPNIHFNNITNAFRRNLAVDTAAWVWTLSDFSGGKFAIWAMEDPSVGTWAEDRSLVAGTTDIYLTSSLSTKGGWASWYYPLFYAASNAPDADGFAFPSFKLFPQNWRIEESFWSRPDGEDLSDAGGHGTDIDGAAGQTPTKLGTIDYISSGYHKGESQWGNAWELIVNASDIGNYDHDFVIGYIDYTKNTRSPMGYARIDTHNASSWANTGESLEVYSVSKALQVKGFFQDAGVSITDWDQFGPGPGDFEVLARLNHATTPTMKYVDLSQLQFDVLTDLASISLNQSIEIQWRAFEDVKDGTSGAGNIKTPAAVDLLGFCDISVGEQKIYYCPISDLVELVSVAHHSLPDWQSGDSENYAQSDFDDHGGAKYISGGTANLFALMLLGDPTGAGVTTMFSRNTGDSYLGQNLWIEEDVIASEIYLHNDAATPVRDADNHWGKDELRVQVSAASADAIRLETTNAAGGMDIDLGTGGYDLITTGAFQVEVDTDSYIMPTTTNVKTFFLGYPENRWASSGVYLKGNAGGTADFVFDAQGGAGFVSISLDASSAEILPVAASANWLYLGAGSGAKNWYGITFMTEALQVWDGTMAQPGDDEAYAGNDIFTKGLFTNRDGWAPLVGRFLVGGIMKNVVLMGREI